MDEPLTSIDERLRLELRSEIKRIQRELGTTMVYVTHEQSEAMTLGDRIGVMREGVLQQSGPPAALYQRPENLFVAGFVGSPPMNLAEGPLTRNGGGSRAVAVAGHRLRLDGETLADRPGIADYEQRQIVIGIR